MSQPRRQKKQLSSMDNVSSLSDQELREALKTYDQAPGPITDSTRNLYRKKLAALIDDEIAGTGASKTVTPSKEDTLTSSPDKSQLAFLASPIIGDDDDDTSDEDFNVQLEEESDGYDDDEEEEEDENEDDEEELTDEPADDVKLSSTTQDTMTSMTLGQERPSRLTLANLALVLAFLVATISLYLYSSTNTKLLQQLQPFKSITKQLLILLILSPIGYGSYRVFKFYKRRRNQEIQRVSKLVTEALELLQSPDNPRGLMPILHIRDTLLSPSERKAKQMVSLWRQAVKFIEEHESRVKVELVNIDGEDFRAWKWIGSKKL